MKRICNFLLSLMLALIFVSQFNTKAVEIPDTYNERIHELRGTWVSTVYNIDIAQQTGSSPLDIQRYKEEYLKVLDTLEEYKMNAIFFQVRPANDAFYESKINPWSRYLIGIEGKDPGWDPLPWLIEEAHKRGIEFHAWLNPYRASMDISWEDDGLNKYLATLPDKSFAKQNPDLLVRGDNRILLNPGEPKVRQHIYDTIEEIIKKYNVDAIHFDDYFYNGVKNDQDDATYRKAGYNPKGLLKSDWRREQVNILIEGIHDLIDGYNLMNNKRVQFGISPAGMWAPGTEVCASQGIPGGHTGSSRQFPCWGYYSYHDLFADSRKWVLEEWIDYILPQNYFELGRYHEDISAWWAQQVKGTKVKLYMGLASYRLGESNFDSEEINKELRYNGQLPEVSGIVLFSYKNLAKPANAAMISAAKSLKDYWTRNTLLPHLYNVDTTGYKAPEMTLKRTQNLIQINISSDEIASGYALYRFNKGEEFNFDDLHLVDIYRNTRKDNVFFQEVKNDEEYTYILQAFMPDGSIHESYSEVFAEKYINKNAPEILNFEIVDFNQIYQYSEKITIKVSANDIDGDRLNFRLHYSTEKDDFRYELRPLIVENGFETVFTLYPLNADHGQIRLIVSDGAHEVVMYSDVFVVKKNVTKLIRAISAIKSNLDTNIQSILK